ncbi:MAG: peptide chain release factor 1 [Paracoccaceae bacterium]|nr:peptide chain release factor 1 [Paracoccaceae bacterium]
MINKDRLNQLIERYEFVEAQLSGSLSVDELKSFGQEYSDLKPIVNEIITYQKLLGSLDDTKKFLEEPEMKNLAVEEIQRIEREITARENSIMISLIPKDKNDLKSVILEVRAGTGGDEASLFAKNLLKMYERFSESQGWAFDILENSITEVGGVREAIVNISGKSVYGCLKFESGVHRVQRVPETESAGRVHTSAATIAVLPEADEIDLEIKQADIRIDTMRASGAGGQHVNTTDSAVRITHLPTGTVVTSSEKSQHQNRAKAMQILRTKLFDIEKDKYDSERAINRRDQVGSGDRSERIRTYNFPQGRVTDHRINLTLYKLDEIMNGSLNTIIDALIASATAKKLSELN